MEDLVSVIMVNYNQNDYTLACVRSVLESEYKNFKILLIDNSPAKQSAEELKKKIELLDDDRIHLCWSNNNIGYVGGINRGLKLSENYDPTYILIMNNDTVIDKSAITFLMDCCKIYNNNAIVTGKVYHYDRPDIFQYIGDECVNKKILKFRAIGKEEQDQGQYEEISERDMIDDIYWLFPWNLYDQIGGYSPYFWFNGESADFALRSKAIHYKLIYTPKAKLWHKGSISIGGRDKNPKRIYFHIQSTLIMRYLHLRSFNFIRFFLKIVLNVTKTSLKAYIQLLIGNRELMKYALAKRKGLSYFIVWIFSKPENTGNIPSRI